MCRNKTNLARWISLCALLAIVAIFTPQAALAQNAGLGVTVTTSSPLVVGQTGVVTTIAMTNQGSGTETITTNSSGTGTETIIFVPSCKATNIADLFCNNAANQDPGVFSVSPSTGTGASTLGAANPTCQAVTFTFTPIGNAQGSYNVSTASTLQLAVGETCTVTFTMTVLKVPTKDAGAASGIQTDLQARATSELASDSSITAGGDGSTQTTVATCAATLDKQVSCDGGLTWQDDGANDDPGNAATKGCVATVGQTVQSRFLVNNTGGAPVSCTLTDTLASGNPFSTIASTPLSLSVGSALSTTTGPTNACNLNFTQNGTDTANLACSCATSTNTVTLTTLHDTAAVACAGVKIDKEISCDAGATFSDNSGGTGNEAGTGLVTANQGGTNGCIGTVGATDVEAKFAAKNTGNVALTCTLGDTNTNFIPSTVTNISLTDNTTPAVGPGTTAAMSCMAARSVSGVVKEPDTATLTCTPTLGGLVDKTTAGSLTVFDSATFDCCGVAIKKQVSCNGGAFTDLGFQTAGTNLAGNSCIANFGNAVAVQFALQNTGTLPLVCTGTSQVDGTSPLNLFDNFIAAPTPTEFTSTVNSIAAGANSSTITDTNITQCNATLATKESAGDQVTTNCECVGSATTGATTDVTAFDEAQINCLPVGTPFSISKTCVGTSGNFTSDVKVTNGGDNSLNCSVVDQTVSTNPNGAVSCPISGGTPITMSPTSLSVALGSGQTGDFTGSITATSTVYNEACVTCAEPSVTCTGTGQGTCNSIANMTASCVSGVCNYEPNSAAQATCTVPTGNCFSRTPGFWGTHPQVTQQVLTENGGSLTVCGIPLSVTTAFAGKNLGKLGPPYSTTEDLCGTGGPDFKPVGTSPQQLQLIRQCTSAALNLVATGKGSTSGGEAICDATNPLIGPMFQACCIAGPNGAAPVCDSGAKPSVISASGCEGFLDAFNNGFEGTDFSTVGLINSPAEPAQCQIANGNGDVNNRNLGPAK